MAELNFPPVDWEETKPALSSEDARRLATAIEGVGSVVARLDQRLAAVETASAPRTALSQMGYIGIQCQCGTSLLNLSNLDFDRLDWATIGRGIFEHIADHQLVGHWYAQQITIRCQPKPT